MVKIVIYPNEDVYNVPNGTDLINAEKYIPFKFGCKRGGCGVCSIKVLKGLENLTQKSDAEKKTLQKKSLHHVEDRLACQCAINGDIDITLAD